MRKLSHEFGTIYVPGPDDRLDQLYRLAQGTEDYWAADTEGTGLNMYAPGFRCRLVQVGTAEEAWVLNPDYHMQAIEDLTKVDETWWHNKIHDALTLEVGLGLDYDAIMDVAQDTADLSRLIDPRPVQKGGTGHKMELLAAHYLGSKSKKEAKTALWEAYGRSAKVKIDEIFAKIPIDNEAYLMYAGQDVLVTARLVRSLIKKMTDHLWKFYDFERPFARRVAEMRRIGSNYDDDWAAQVESEYDTEAEQAEDELIKKWGINQTATYASTSAKSLTAKFESLGVKWTKFSEKTHKPSLDKDVMTDLSLQKGDIGELARCVTRAKQNHHYGGYIRGMRAELGFDGRLHPNIQPMAAATHRMSISNPPIQQFPRDDHRVRGCILADEGHAIITADYAQVEFRVGAAVSGDQVMISKILAGEDLHEATATALFGPNFTKPQRQIAKPVGFGCLYLGGAKGILTQMMKADPIGAPTLPAVKRSVDAQNKLFWQYKRWALRLKDSVEKNNGLMKTATGRLLRVDPSYAAPNYYIQSTARDLFAIGINEIHKAGLGQYLRLVVHDEAVVSAPIEQAQEIGEAVAECMSSVFKSVPIEVEWDIKGARWAK